MKKTKLLCVLICILLVFSSLPLGVSAAETEIADTGLNEYFIETYEELITLANAPYDERILILQNDIIQTDNKNNKEIVITNNSTVNIDLNGYTIMRETQGNDQTLFRIKSDATLVMYDSSSAQTGTCIFSEGYANYQKAVFINDGGELQIHSGTYEILSPHNQGTCSVVYTTSGLTQITGGTFDSSTAWGGDTISVGHDAYLYVTPLVIITGGDFYGKYQSIDISPFGNFLGFGCLFPNVYVMGGNFYICNKGTKDIKPGFAYCNNGWGRVLVAEGTVYATSLNQTDQRYLPGVTKQLSSHTIDNFTGGYYEVTAPPMMMPLGEEKYDHFYYERLFNLCNKALVKTYNEETYLKYKEHFDILTNTFDTIYVGENEAVSPKIYLENRTDKISYIRWYMCNEKDYNGKNTEWTYLGNFDDVVQIQLEDRPEYAQDILLRCDVTYSDHTSYEDIIRISYETYNDPSIISSFELTDLALPSLGTNPDFELTPAQNSYYINNVYWADITESTSVPIKETDTFTVGHKYRLEVWLRASDGYLFHTDEDEWLDATAKINGIDAIVAAGNNTSAIVQLEFTMPEPIIISEADVMDVDAPLEGEKLDTDATCITTGCSVSSVKWYDITDGTHILMEAEDTFQAGHIYRVNIMLETEGGVYSFLMVDRYNEATGYINGKRAIAAAADEDNWLQLGFIFPACEENPELTTPSEDTEPTEATDPTEDTKPTESTDPTEDTKPTESTDPTEDTKPTESTDPTEDTKPTESTDPTEDTKPTESTDPTEDTKPTESTDPTEDTKPTESTDPTEDTKPTESTDPTEDTKPTESTDPTEDTKPTESTDPTEDTKPTESTDPTEDTKPTETEKPTEPDTEPSVLGLLGDANEDGVVNVKDATAIQKHIASLITLSDTGVILADADQNSVVNIKDATAIQKFVAGLPTGLDIGKPVEK